MLPTPSPAATPTGHPAWPRLAHGLAGVLAPAVYTRMIAPLAAEAGPDGSLVLIASSAQAVAWLARSCQRQIEQVLEDEQLSLDVRFRAAGPDEQLVPALAPPDAPVRPVPVTPAGGSRFSPRALGFVRQLARSGADDAHILGFFRKQYPDAPTETLLGVAHEERTRLAVQDEVARLGAAGAERAPVEDYTPPEPTGILKQAAAAADEATSTPCGYTPEPMNDYIKLPNSVSRVITRERLSFPEQAVLVHLCQLYFRHGALAGAQALGDGVEVSSADIAEAVAGSRRAVCAALASLEHRQLIRRQRCAHEGGLYAKSRYWLTIAL